MSRASTADAASHRPECSPQACAVFSDPQVLTLQLVDQISCIGVARTPVCRRSTEKQAFLWANPAHCMNGLLVTYHPRLLFRQHLYLCRKSECIPMQCFHQCLLALFPDLPQPLRHNFVRPRLRHVQVVELLACHDEVYAILRTSVHRALKNLRFCLKVFVSTEHTEHRTEHDSRVVPAS